MALLDITPEIQAEIRRQVEQVIMKMGIEFRHSTSSVEIGRTSNGKPTVTVKVYHDDPYAAANKARDIESQLTLEYQNIPASGRPPLQDTTGGAPAPSKPAAITPEVLDPDDENPFS